MTNRNRAVFWVLAVFLLGAFSGGSIVYFLKPVSTATDVPERPRRKTPEEQWVELVRNLQLTPEQEPKVKQILDEARSQTETTLKQLRAHTDDRLKQVLTPEQFTEWQRMVNERRRHRGAPRP